jgi:glycosyltransferase involved in cell wall biosynthesis
VNEDTVTVVIPNYNYERFLPQALDSVFAQTHPRLDVIVVDDGSTDGSDKVLAQYQGRLRWFRQKNQGVSAARNKGIAEGRGQFVAFLDADDFWMPDKLERQLAAFADPRVGLVYTGVRYVDREGATLRDKPAATEGDILADHALMRPTVLAGGSSALVRKACFERVGVFDARLSTSADWDMWRRIACHFRVAMVSEPLIGYRMHSTAMHRNVPLFERDMLHAFSQMFRDPDARAVWPLRRRAYATLYTMFSGAYLNTRNWKKAVSYGVRSLVQRPDRIALRALGLPVRKVRRFLRPGVHALD